MSNEVYNLTWNEFEKCTGMTFKDLLEDKDFSNVTLVSEDGEKISAHKMVLSSCSPILRKMLIGTPQHQPVLLYLTGIQFSEISSLLKFMYLGETNILQEDAAYTFISELGTSDNCAQYGKLGNMFSCDKCEYKAKWAQKMKLHIDAKHNNVKYSCEICAYSSGYPHHLYTHKKTKHSFN